ncbi:Arylsulfatase [Novipirellula aureliae]|uniref:Arylsulfatase n=1 Tax=Novipirellula aureliae TaxID=2527966 RepID=A0A5C6DCU6_9BACT|nr:sulfatase [Novipirellula aureliae]TWU34600.1 Arylsulfatase [Novipirellula aureliae]
MRNLIQCLCVVLLSTSSLYAQPKPNVVLILADDLGWQDLKCYDVDAPSAYDTPNLDAFAKKGVMFWQAYSPAPTCSPSRCAILSGNHPARAQKTHVVGGRPPAPRNSRSRMIDPWYSGRMPEDTFTLARAMKANGYTSGHAGKWHIAINHSAFPQPADVGFDYTRSTRGAHSSRGMDNRLSGFATTAKDDPYRLDANGFPYHQNNEDALTFLRENKDKPFFLYYCTWLVHSPIVTRNEALLKKYAERMGVEPQPQNDKSMIGQKNPFYGAMVESLDYYVGQVFQYLETTEDPRWPGHMLSENTYIIFASDNGGVKGYTDNTPLDRGKSSAKEGGTRVPMMIVGPGISAGVQSDVRVNGLDFYPTILSLTGSQRPEGKNLDGCDLAPLLLGDPKDPTMVKDTNGSVRDTTMWHFPHGNSLESTLIVGDYKLIRNYDHVNNDGTPELEVFQLYRTENGKRVRVDIEEANNLAAKMPEKAAAMNARLTEILTEMDASYPYYNPSNKTMPGQSSVCTVNSHKATGNSVEFVFTENGAKVVRADLLYTLNGGKTHEEWFRTTATLKDSTTASVELPAGTTHYYLNLVDENNFLVSYPEVGQNGAYSNQAIPAN